MLRDRIHHHPLAAFVVVAFGWSWAWDALYLGLGWWGTVPTTFPRQWGVPLGAVVAVWASDTSLRRWLGRIGRWRLHPGWYLLAVVVPLAITNGQQVVRAAGGGSLRLAPPAGLPLVVLFVLANAVLLGGIEEVGWRGYLQPRLQERTSVLTAGVAVGAVWWAWHLPLFLGHPNFVAEPRFVLRYTAFVLGAAVVLGAVVDAVDGSVLPAMLLHATTNLGPLVAGSGGPLDGSELVGLVVGSGAWWLLALALVALFGTSMHPGGGTDVPP
jgi:membrane protease YdiL (CAAX protease family)